MAEKVIWDLKLTKWQAKTFWWFFCIAIIGGLSGIVSLVWQIAR